MEAYSARRTLDLLASGEQFDGVVTDHATPSMTGLELAGKISESRPDMAIILASGYAEIPSEGKLAKRLMRLQKPFSQEELEPRSGFRSHRRRDPPQPSGKISVTVYAAISGVVVPPTHNMILLGSKEQCRYGAAFGDDAHTLGPRSECRISVTHVSWRLAKHGP